MIELVEDKWIDLYEEKDFTPASDEEVKEMVDFYSKMGQPDKAEMEVYMDLWRTR